MRIKHLFFKVTGKLMKKLVFFNFDLQTDKLIVLCNSTKFLDYLKAIINKSFIIISCIVQNFVKLNQIVPRVYCM